MARNKYPEETVKLILSTAARLFVEKGYDKTSLQDIISATHLSKGAIYHHFASKEEIFITVCEQVGEENAALLSKVRDDSSLNGLDKLKKLFKIALTQANQEQMLHMVPYLLDSPKFLAIQIRSLYEEVAPEYVLPILEEGLADGSISTEYPQELAEVLVILSDLWLHPLLRPTTTAAVRARCELFIQLTKGIGLDLFDQEIIDTYIRYSEIINQKSN